MKKHLPYLTGGFIIWLVPFLSSFFFYTPESELKTSIFIFKTVMITLMIVTTWFISRRMLTRKEMTAKNAVKGGLIFLAVNLVLDLLILVPLFMPVMEWATTVALTYIAIPATAILAVRTAK